MFSCLLVNHFYCNIAVEILWKDIFDIPNDYKHCYRSYVKLSIVSTLIACLPNESKDILHKNGVCIIIPTKKPPLFNYPTFCKFISTHEINQNYTFRSQQLITPEDLKNDEHLL
jgi:hypothetical protein